MCVNPNEALHGAYISDGGRPPFFAAGHQLRSEQLASETKLLDAAPVAGKTFAFIPQDEQIELCPVQ